MLVTEGHVRIVSANDGKWTVTARSRLLSGTGLGGLNDHICYIRAGIWPKKINSLAGVSWALWYDKFERKYHGFEPRRKYILPTY